MIAGLHSFLELKIKYIYIYTYTYTYQFSPVQSLSRVRLFATPWTAARQASLSITNSQSSLKLMSIESVMPSNHLILCCPLLLPPSIFPSIRVFSNESVLCIRWPKYWRFSFSMSPPNEHPHTCTGWAGSPLLRRLFLVAGSGGYSPATVLRLRTAAAFLTVERGLSGTRIQ